MLVKSPQKHITSVYIFPLKGQLTADIFTDEKQIKREGKHGEKGEGGGFVLKKIERQKRGGGAEFWNFEFRIYKGSKLNSCFTNQHKQKVKLEPVGIPCQTRNKEHKNICICA